MTASDIQPLVAAFLVCAGALLTLSASVGLVRFGDTLTRMHPAAKPQVLGLVLVVSGAIVQTWGVADTFMLFLIALFALVTSPVIANRVGNVAYMEALAQEAAARDDDETEKEEEGDRA